MARDLKCKPHKYIGKKIEAIPDNSGLPFECKKCRKIFFSENTSRIESLSHQIITFCSACRTQIKCAGCKRKLNIKDLFVAECIKCGQVEFFCPKCSKKIFILPLKPQPQDKILLKLKEILKEVIPELGDSLPEDLEDLKKYKGFGNMPSILLFYFNIGLSGFSDFEDEDDADWWKK